MKIINENVLKPVDVFSGCPRSGYYGVNCSKSKSHLQRKMAWCQISFILISGNLKNVSYLKQVSFSSYLKYLACTKDSNVGS